MKIWENFTLAFSKYAQFNGRSRRGEFWGFILITMLLGIAASSWDGIFFGNSEALENLLDVVFFIPSIAVGARRLHDTGRSGWWQLIALTGVGVILLIIWWAQDSDEYPNNYGYSPKYGEDVDYGAPLKSNDHDDQIL
jgi:uncharacterized membrane protein YhaH (DUF805 family)